MTKTLQDLGAERAVLAGLFAYGLESYIEVSDILDHNSFAVQNNQIIFKCVEKIFASEAEVDIASFISAAERLGFAEIFKDKRELNYIKSLMDYPVKRDNILHFCAQVKKFELARRIKSLAAKISHDAEQITGDEDIDDIVSIIENPIVDFLKEDDNNKRPEKIGEGLDEYIEFLLENKCDQLGIPTGFNRYDAAIGGGLRRKCVDLISARPKVGKSVFGDNVAINVAKQGIPVLMLDTEMSKEDHLNRILASISKVSINDISTGAFEHNEEQHIAVQNAVEEIKSIPYTYATVAGMPFESILNVIKRWVLQEVGTDENGRTNECLVVYDYLKLMSSTSITNNIQEYQALGFQITNLHNLAVKYDFACLSFVQLNRDGITKESTDAVSGSDRLIWLCTSFSIFKEKSAEELAEDGPSAGNRKLVPIVSRHGPGMQDGNYINLNMSGQHALLTELRTRDELVATGGVDAIEGAELPFEEDNDE
jgi:replicative DNA helicase